MKEQTNLISNNENNTKLSDGSGWLKNQCGSVVVGIIVSVVVSIVIIIVQIFANPRIAKQVKKEESILEQKYKAYENAINIMHRHLASVDITGENVPKWYKPPEKTRPTQVETNVAYTLLTIYSESNVIAEQFYSTFGAPEIKGAPSSDVRPYIRTNCSSKAG